MSPPLMSRDTRSVGLAFLLSVLLVMSVAVAANLLLAPPVIQTACPSSYSLSCAF